MAGRKAHSGKTAVFGVLLLLAAALWCVFRIAVKPNLGIPGATNAERIAYISSFGWETSPVPSNVEEIRIPARFDEAYEQYNALQKEQGFDLKKYCAVDCHKYTYKSAQLRGSRSRCSDKRQPDRRERQDHRRRHLFRGSQRLCGGAREKIAAETMSLYVENNVKIA